MQSFFVFNAPPDPFRVLMGATGTTHIEVSRACSVYWVDGQPGPQAGVEVPYGVNTAIQDSAGSPTVDTTLNTYMVVAFQEDTTQFWLLPEIDYSALDTLLAESPFSTTEKHWGILAYIQGTQVYIPPQVWVPRIREEGDLLVGRSSGDPTDPATPPVLTRLPVGEVGQIIHVVPDASGYMSPFDPHQATNHTADPAYTTLTLANGLMAAWKYDANGNPLLSEVPVGTDGQVLAAKSNPSAHDNTGATLASDEPIYQDIAWVLKHLLDTKGSLVKGGAGTPAGDSVKLSLGTQYQVLTSDGADALWKDLAYSLVHYLQSVLTTRGDLLTMDASDLPKRIGIGANFDILTSNGTDPSWQGIAYALAGFLSANGQLITRISGSPALLGIGTTDQILTVSSGLPSWQDIKKALGNFLADAGDLAVGTGSSADAAVLGPGADKTILRSNGTGAALTWDDLPTLLASYMTRGDLITRSAGLLEFRGIGGSGQVLVSDGTEPIWGDLAAIIKAVLLTTPGDILVNDSGTIKRLGAPSQPSVLVSFGSFDVSWYNPGAVGNTWKTLQVNEFGMQWV